VDVTGPEARSLCPPDRVRPRRKREGGVRPLASGARRKRSPEASHRCVCARAIFRRVRGRLGRSRVGSGLKSPHWMPRAEACAQPRRSGPYRDDKTSPSALRATWNLLVLPSTAVSDPTGSAACRKRRGSTESQPFWARVSCWVLSSAPSRRAEKVSAERHRTALTAPRAMPPRPQFLSLPPTEAVLLP